MTLQEPLVYASLPQADEVSSSTNAPTVVGRIVEDDAVMRNESNVTANRNSHPSEVNDPSTDPEDVALRSCHPSLTKTNVGAACVGALIGLILLGPIGGNPRRSSRICDNLSGREHWTLLEESR
jgi:hypothetical protein